MITDPVAASRVQQPIALELALIAGLVAIFLANAIAAVAEPATYRHILESSAISRAAGLDHHRWSTTLIAATDGLIGTGLVASAFVRAARRPLLAVAGGWLGIAGLLKLSSCFG